MSPQARMRRKYLIGLGLLFTILVVLCIALIPYRPVIVPGPIVEDASLKLPPPIAGVRLHVFNTGTNRMSSLLVGPSPPWRGAPAFIVEHPTEGLIAFDLGLSHQVAEHGEDAIAAPIGWLMESRGRVGFTLEHQMSEAKLPISAVRYVVISHLHGDHLGIAGELTHAVFIGGANTKAGIASTEDSPFEADSDVPEWLEISESEIRAPDTALLKANQVGPIGPFQSAIDLFGDGSVILIATGGGHTDEDVMMLLNLPGGPVLLTGDAVVHFDWLASDDVERIASDPNGAATVRNQVRMLRETGAALIIPGHDLTQLGPVRADLVLHHPERFKSSFWPIE